MPGARPIPLIQHARFDPRRSGRVRSYIRAHCVLPVIRCGLCVRLLYEAGGEHFLGKIAIDLKRALARRAMTGAAGCATPRIIAQGEGWRVADVICTSGPEDRPFEEQHHRFSIAIVAAGSFQYRSRLGRELMTPGSIMLGNAGQCYECGHEHGAGDRCVAFWYAPDYFDRLAADAGMRGVR